VLASYLLVKGARTFINMWIGAEPQWFPEYGVRLGRALAPPPANIDALRVGRLYVRRYARGLVAVNPGSAAASLRLATSMKLVRPVGGGALDARADTKGRGLRLPRVSGSVTVPAHDGIVLLSR
jgi:hypothetical protein